MEIGKSEGDYTIKRMQQMATVAQMADGIEISGNDFKVTALCGCPDMVLFACEEILNLQLVLDEIQNSLGDISGFVENLDVDIAGRDKAFQQCLEAGNKIRNLDLPEFIYKQRYSCLHYNHAFNYQSVAKKRKTRRTKINYEKVGPKGVMYGP